MFASQSSYFHPTAKYRLNGGNRDNNPACAPTVEAEALEALAIHRGFSRRRYVRRSQLRTYLHAEGGATSFTAALREEARRSAREPFRPV
jgi:hypothetical protein